MTSPTIIQSPGGLDILTQSFTHALQLSQQLSQQRQQLQIEQQKAQAQIAEAGAQAGEARARTKAIETETQQKLDDLESQHQAVRLVMGHLDGDDTAFAQALQGVDPAVAAHALTFRSTFLKGQQDVQESRARTEKLGADVQALADEHAFNQQILPTVQEMLSHPNAPIPKDPTVAQAAALAKMGALQYVTQRMTRELQEHGENAQADLAARTAIMEAYKTATQQRTEWQFQHGNEEAPSFDTFFEQALQPLGVSPKDAQQVITESFQSFLRRHGRPGAPQAPIAAPPTLDAYFARPVYTQAPATVQRAALDAAYAVAQGKPVAPNTPDEWRAWILGAAARLKARKRLGQ